MPDSNDFPHKKQADSSFCSALKTGLLLSGAALGAAAAVNTLIAWNTPTASPHLGGAFNRTPLRYGDAAYAVSGSGSPVLLLHTPRPGGSSAEWQRNFDALAKKHTVYALDFLGWGLSDKPRHMLSPQDYAEQILHFARNVIGEKSALIASGMAANFVLLAAHSAPELFSKIALVCPETSPGQELSIMQSTSGKSTSGQSAFARSTSMQSTLRYRLLTLPVVGEALVNWFSSRAQLERKAREELYYDGARVTPQTVSKMHVAAHQPGAQHAHAAYLSNLLETDWREAWSRLSLPALLLWGREAAGPGIASAPEWLALNPNARLEVFDRAKLLPHIERSTDFNARILGWLED